MIKQRRLSADKKREKKMCPEITVDLSEAVELGGVVPGKYGARVSGAEVKTTNAGTGQYVKWEMTIFGAEGELARYNNHKVWHNTMTSGKGAGMLKKFVKAATGQELTGNLDTDAVLGKEVLVTLKEGKRDGVPTGYPEVVAVNPFQPF